MFGGLASREVVITGSSRSGVLSNEGRSETWLLLTRNSEKSAGG